MTFVEYLLHVSLMLNILQMSIISHNFPTYPEVCTIVTQFIKNKQTKKKHQTEIESLRKLSKFKDKSARAQIQVWVSLILESALIKSVLNC